MKKLCGIAVLLAVAIVCLRQRQATPDPEGRFGTAVPAANPAPSSGPIVPETETSAPAVQPSEQIVDEGSAIAPAVSSAAADAADASAAVAGSSVASRERHGKLNSPQKPLTAETAYLATLPPVETIVLEEEENGQVIFQADPATMGPDGFPLLLQAAMEKPDEVAAVDLVAMFQSEESAETKLEILSASSLLEPDQNTQKLLELALGPDQPQELRIAAVAYMADQDPSKLASYFHDSDPDVSLEAQSAYERLSLPAPTTIIGYQAQPPPQNLATPPDSINYVRTH
ncbi:MAG: hypothetical protein ABSH38_19860 [Verrucomicrobiota bacterium]|jgi:hypothetical protein